MGGGIHGLLEIYLLYIVHKMYTMIDRFASKYGGIHGMGGSLTAEDLLYIAHTMYPMIKMDLPAKMVKFNKKVKKGFYTGGDGRGPH